MILRNIPQERGRRGRSGSTAGENGVSEKALAERLKEQRKASNGRSSAFEALRAETNDLGRF
ncbi:hypothetical protein A3J33_03015 [candidate division WWE3 bacterium RIFCSPLOWO2_02_FULL_53_10]|jgi:hypothetical protein|uniref:Uncharacterized protein n=1 Tax=candidate division WWE3 bacterium RIFCSPLOWO2_02_FULL_53_10 TaxID=1802629 RepID=A0A1F4WFB3_UNCKA|nr:MAG: hypothetical protein A3J33_03015 [candidate division WWE3 bacterium RIFCSPLOWO2_02_FULL_53_10]